MDEQDRSIKNRTIREIPKIRSEHQRHEKYEIRWKITKIKNWVCNVKITEVMNLREDIKIDEKIRVTYDFILNIT